MAEWGGTAEPTWDVGAHDATESCDNNGSDTATVVVDSAEYPIDVVALDGNTNAKQEKKVWRIRKNEIEELQNDRLDGTEKFIPIFKRAGKGRALEIYREKFPRKALMVFSEVWKKEIERSGSAAHLIIEEISGSMVPYDLILDWIELCIDEGNDIKFPEIGESCNQLHVLLDIVAVADYLKIPGKSLQEPLKKAAIRYARKNLIDLDYVARLYDESDPEYDGGDRMLQEAAAASIFEGWWSRQLDEPKYDEYCSYVEQLRAEFEQLDKDLNACFDEKKSFIQAKREERRNKTPAAPVATVVHTSDAADDGWGAAANGAAVAQDEWAATVAPDGDNQSPGNRITDGDTGGW